MKLTNKLFQTIPVTALLVIASPSLALAQAGDAKADAKAVDESIWTRDKFSGDWFGMRSDLSNAGVDVDLRLTQYWQRVATGGKQQNDEYGGTMDYRVNFDGGKLIGAQGWSINMHARTRFGEDISPDVGAFVLENAGMLMPAPGDYHETDITGLVVSKAFPIGDATIGDITVGKLDVLDTVTGFFPGFGNGQEGFWNANSSVSALPWFGAVAGLSLYGGYGVTVDKATGTATNGLLITGTENVSTEWGSLSDSFDDVWIAAFHRFLWATDDGRPGYFMIFGGYSTKEQNSNDPHDFIFKHGEGIESTEDKRPWDIALYFTQDLWHADGNANRKVTLLSGGTFGPDNPQFSQYNFFTNVEMFGPFASRPYDRVGLAGFWNSLSDNYKDLVRPVVELQNLWGFELYYSYAIAKSVHLTADLQLVETEIKDDDLAVIPGVRLMIDF
jgi:porin